MKRRKRRKAWSFLVNPALAESAMAVAVLTSGCGGADDCRSFSVSSLFGSLSIWLPSRSLIVLLPPVVWDGDILDRRRVVVIEDAGFQRRHVSSHKNSRDERIYA